MSQSASCHAFPSFCYPTTTAAAATTRYSRSLLVHIYICTPPPGSFSLQGTHTYTDNTAATCCFGNVLQQASVLHCSPFYTIAIPLVTSGREREKKQTKKNERRSFTATCAAPSEAGAGAFVTKRKEELSFLSLTLKCKCNVAVHPTPPFFYLNIC